MSTLQSTPYFLGLCRFSLTLIHGPSLLFPLAEILCPQLFDPTNGSVAVDSQEIGSVAFYECNSGFLLFGDGIRTCKEDGQWSGLEPYCQGN